jgi:hypothetical protein
MRIRFLALFAAALCASCASPPKPSTEEISRLWSETFDDWTEVQKRKLDTLEGDDREEFAEEYGELLTSLTLVRMASILDAVGDYPWHGYVKIDGDLRTGHPVTIRLSTCPPGRKFILYGSPGLSRPVLRPGEDSNDYWILDLDRQTVEGEGIIDADGEAAVTVVIPADAYRAFQARLLGDTPGLKGQMFTKAHGKKIP